MLAVALTKEADVKSDVHVLQHGCDDVTNALKSLKTMVSNYRRMILTGILKTNCCKCTAKMHISSLYYSLLLALSK